LASFIKLALDISPPKVEILSPNYTTTQAKTEIRVSCNEVLDTWQDIYIIDSLGNRHDLTFRYEENEFVGVLYFTDYPYGIATIYAQVRDDVYNKSALLSKTINIVGSETLTLKISDYRLGSFKIGNKKFGVVNVKTEEA
jgi:hypothetical protein